MSQPLSFMCCPECKGHTNVRPERDKEQAAGAPQAWFSREFCPSCKIRRIRHTKQWEADS